MNGSRFDSGDGNSPFASSSLPLVVAEGGVVGTPPTAGDVEGGAGTPTGSVREAPVPGHERQTLAPPCRLEHDSRHVQV
jgi:hypothetical protein